MFVKAICGSLGAEYRICSKPAYNFSGPLVYLASSITALLSEIVSVSACGRNGGLRVTFSAVGPPPTPAAAESLSRMLNCAALGLTLSQLVGIRPHPRRVAPF